MPVTDEEGRLARALYLEAKRISGNFAADDSFALGLAVGIGLAFRDADKAQTIRHLCEYALTARGDLPLEQAEVFLRQVMERVS